MLRLLVILASLACAHAQPYTISGTVLDADSASGIGNARIEIQAQNQQQIAVLSTVTGSFTITNVPAGNYFLYATKAGFVPSELPDKNSAQSLSLTGSAATMEAKIWLRRQASIEGTITNESGLARPGISVNLLRVIVEGGRPRYEIANGASTDSSGAFRIPSLQAGSYLLGVNLIGGQNMESGKEALPSLFFPNTTEPAQAKLLTLSSGATETASMKVPSVPAFSVRGKVETNGLYPSMMLRAARLPGMPFAREFQGIWNQASQTFSFSGIPSGIYTAEAILHVDGKQRIATEQVIVMDKDVSGLILKPR